MGVNLSGSTPTTPGTPGGIAQAIHDAIAAAGGIGGVLAGVVNGIIGGIVGAVQGIAHLIGGLFSLGRQDTAAVDQKRVEGELAIVANMSSSLEYLDEIQRVGGAFSDTPEWNITYGELNPHPIPLGSAEPVYRGAFPLAQGTAWHPPVKDWLWSHGHTLAGSDSARGLIAERAGTLELMESGLWMIYFQAALLQGTGYPNTPADVWCYVTDQKDYVPVGAPVPGMDSYHRLTGSKSTSDVHGYSAIHTFGRAGQYLGVRDTTQGGGNTVSGYMMAYLDSPGWFVHMAASAYKHFGGPASTFVFAQKVNSSTLRGDIDQAQADLAAALPGQPIAQQLDEAVIAAMIAEADAIDVTSEEPQP
ncbi:hypothetical protein [Dietzia maris]|uniref:hypothetical protein n=1 Tax=Dietzia maris TaxID=37915 RepID=UPI0037C60B0A